MGNDSEAFSFKGWFGEYAPPHERAQAIWRRTEPSRHRPTKDKISAAACLAERPASARLTDVAALARWCGDPGPSVGGTGALCGVLLSRALLAAGLVGLEGRVFVWPTEPLELGYARCIVRAIVVGADDDSWRLTLAPCVRHADSCDHDDEPLPEFAGWLP